MTAREFEGKKVVVAGLGRLGGGVGVTRWLSEQGAQVVVTDLADAQALKPSMAQLKGLDIQWRLGQHTEADLEHADWVVVNPAIDPARSEFIRAAASRNIPRTTEMRLFLERCPSRIVGVTGSAGKSTTCAMIFDVLYAHRDELADRPHCVWLGGNIGVSLLSELPQMQPDDWVVLELSSFQLEGLQGLAWRPSISVVTTLFPQHLDRHGDFEAYVSVKAGLFANQQPGDKIVLGSEAAAALNKGMELPDGPDVIVAAPALDLQGRLSVRGAHQLVNASIAREVCLQAGLAADRVTEALCRFEGLAHRLEWVREYQQVNYYNDSKSTTVAATSAALGAFDESMVLMVGGEDRPGDLQLLAEQICKRVRVVVCFGTARARIAAAIRRLADVLPMPVIKTVHDFGGGVNLARRLARPAEIVLFSPGFASYDNFANFEQRGDRFKAIVNGWL